MNGEFDYSVRDSSIVPDRYTRAVVENNDNAIRIGIVREERVLKDGSTRYIVEVARGGRQIPVSCILMARWGGVHNFEEYRVRPWIKNFPANNLLPPSAGTFNKRAGDVVIVAFLDGQSREGVILGGCQHPARVQDKNESTKKGSIEYINRFNGIETQIRANGSYKVTFNGANPLNEKALALPPLGQTPPAPIYLPNLAGSFYGFDPDGSFMVTDGKGMLIKLEKSLVTGNLILKSGTAKIELSGTPFTGFFNLKADTVAAEAKTISMKAAISHTVESTLVSMKGIKMAIGNDVFELFQGLSDLIDALGTVVVTSPVGPCTPILTAPTWPQVIALQLKIKTLISSLSSAGSASFSGNDSTDSIGDDVGS